MPPHRVYIEPFLGGGAIMRLKKKAAVNIGIDVDAGVIASYGGEGLRGRIDGYAGEIPHRQSQRGGPAPHVTSGDDRSTFQFIVADALEFLAEYQFAGDELVYCDPPYMHETRTRLNYYKYEMANEQHGRLLEVIKKIRARVMISGYFTRLYMRELLHWNSTNFQAMTRGGRMATEWLWYNFPEPVALHDYSFLGENFRERERIKRKTTRWRNKLAKMPILERRALMAALESTSPPAPVSAVGCGCCARAGEYNGFASGPLSFTCPKSCPCHD